MSELFLYICKKGGTDIVRTLSSIKYFAYLKVPYPCLSRWRVPRFKRITGEMTLLMKEMAMQFFDKMAAGIPNEDKPKCLYYYLEGVRQVKVKQAIEGSLRISVECPTLKILEQLWEDYCSGHLNAVAEECLLTEDIKRRFHVESVSLKTRILEEDYLACKEFLKGNSSQLSFVSFGKTAD